MKKKIVLTLILFICLNFTSFKFLFNYKADELRIPCQVSAPYQRRSTIIASRLPAEKWYYTIRDSIVADAIHDRLVHTYRAELYYESMKKKGKDKILLLLKRSLYTVLRLPPEWLPPARGPICPE